VVWVHGEHDTHDRLPALPQHRPSVDFTNDRRRTTHGRAVILQTDAPSSDRRRGPVRDRYVALRLWFGDHSLADAERPSAPVR
jgi:hypothetical protein